MHRVGEKKLYKGSGGEDERLLVGGTFCSFGAEVPLVVILSKGQATKDIVREFN